MTQHRPVGEAVLHNYTAKARMGVDEAGSAKSDDKMLLRNPGRDEKQVAPARSAGHFDKRRCLRHRQMTTDIDISKRVGGRNVKVDSDSPQREEDDAHAVDACCWIAAMKHEFAACQTLRRRREPLGPARHRGCGYCSRKSVPGKCGSP